MRRALDVVLALAVLLGAWQLAASVAASAVLPPPAAVLRWIGAALVSGDLVAHVASSLLRVLHGLAVAALFAIPLAFLLAPAFRAGSALVTVLELLRPIPPIAWIPLAVLWFGVGDGAAVFIVAIAAFFPMFTATYAGLRAIPPIYLRVARNFGAAPLVLATEVLLPAIRAPLLAGLRIAVGVGWASVIAAEMIAARSGLGYAIQLDRIMLDFEGILGGMIAIGVIGFGSNTALARLASRADVPATGATGEASP